MSRLATRAGIEKGVHPHGLRHTHACELMMAGVPVPIIQQQLAMHPSQRLIGMWATSHPLR
jgi:integrase